jgi:hypothetical protein
MTKQQILDLIDDLLRAKLNEDKLEESLLRDKISQALDQFERESSQSKGRRF